jgi:hypothetical protein
MLHHRADSANYNTVPISDPNVSRGAARILAQGGGGCQTSEVTGQNARILSRVGCGGQKYALFDFYRALDILVTVCGYLI